MGLLIAGKDCLLYIFIVYSCLLCTTLAKDQALRERRSTPLYENSTITSHHLDTVLVTEVIYETIFTTSSLYALDCSSSPIHFLTSSSASSTVTTSTFITTPGAISVGNVVTSISIAPTTIDYVTCITYDVEIYIFYTTFYTGGSFTSSLVATTVIPGGSNNALPTTTSNSETPAANSLGPTRSRHSIGPFSNPSSVFRTPPATTPSSGSAVSNGQGTTKSYQSIGLFSNSSISSQNSSSTSTQVSMALLFTPVIAPSDCPHLPIPTAGLTKIDSNATMIEQVGIQYSFYLDSNGNIAPELGLLDTNGNYFLFDLSNTSAVTFFLADGSSAVLDADGTITFFSPNCSVAAYTVLPLTQGTEKRQSKMKELVDDRDKRSVTSFGLGITIVDQCGSLQVSLSPSATCNGIVFGPAQFPLLTYDGLITQLQPAGDGSYQGICGFTDIQTYVSKCFDQLEDIFGFITVQPSGSRFKPRFLAPSVSPELIQEVISSLRADFIEVLPVLEETGGVVAEELTAVLASVTVGELALGAFLVLELYAYEFGTEGISNYFCQHCFQSVQMKVVVEEDGINDPLLTASAAPSTSLITTLVVDQTTSSCSSSTFSSSFSTSFSSSSSSSTSTTSSSSTSSSSSCTSYATATPLYAPNTDDCTTSQGYGQSVFCCSGACIDGTSIGNPGLCESWTDLCGDLASGPPTCDTNQVLGSGNGGQWVPSGDGNCWGGDECQWQKNNWTWSCCDCPTGYSNVILGACEGNYDAPWPCVACEDDSATLAGSAASGYSCLTLQTEDCYVDV